MATKILQIVALTILVCSTAGVAEQYSTSTYPHGFGRIPDHLRSEQSHGMYIDPHGFGKTPDQLSSAQSHGLFADPFGTISESREM
ncbi:MAG: hypothetical protein GY854_00150 [Deltaproteobacteria bacterium]|nr:hypothetical protein [Deltaproteobacteria bacterium]